MMKEYEGISDEELIRRAQNGEKKLEEFLIDKYKSMVRKKAHDRRGTGRSDPGRDDRAFPGSERLPPGQKSLFCHLCRPVRGEADL